MGRGLENHIVFDYPGISRHHAIITWEDDHFAVKDLGSMNGTAVNGQLLTRPQNLSDGAHIQLEEVEIDFFEVTSSTQDQDAIQAEMAEVAAGESADETFVVEPDSPRPRLVVTAGPEEGREILLHRGTITFGRATSREQWDVSLQDRAVSRPHAKIKKRKDEFIVTDAGSANGTLLNGELIEEPTQLRDGDVLELGQTTLLFRAV